MANGLTNTMEKTYMYCSPVGNNFILKGERRGGGTFHFLTSNLYFWCLNVIIVLQYINVLSKPGWNQVKELHSKGNLFSALATIFFLCSPSLSMAFCSNSWFWWTWQKNTLSQSQFVKSNLTILPPVSRDIIRSNISMLTGYHYVIVCLT